MILELSNKNRGFVRPLFETHRRARAIIFPAIDQGRGIVVTNSLETPTVACLHLAPINAVAGDSTSPDAKEVIRSIEPMQAVFAPDSSWAQIIKDEWGEQLGVIQRIKLSPKSLEVNHLKHLKSQLPPGYTLESMDLETIKRLDKRKSMHILNFFGSSEEFYKMGLAFCIKFEGKVVSMASTYTPFTDMFEVEIDTFDEQHRRKGLATVVSAALLVYALEHGITPHWDAENQASLHLALKLGYVEPDYWDAYYQKAQE
jgi:GNAT superfamily N-acetyltransferase